MEYARDFKLEEGLRKDVDLGKNNKPTLMKLRDMKLQKMIKEDSFSTFRFTQRGQEMISPVTTRLIHVSALDKPRFLLTISTKKP